MNRTVHIQYIITHLRVFYTLPPPPPSSLFLSLPLSLFTFFSTVVRSFLITLASQISTAYSSLYFVMKASSSFIIFVFSSHFRRVSLAFVSKSFNSLHSRSTILREREGERKREREKECRQRREKE